MPHLNQIAEATVAGGRGILAADESIRTMSARLEAEGVDASETSRRDYRELLVTAPGLSATINGVLLCQETFAQSTSSGEPFPQACRDRGLLPGVTVDTGTSELPRGGGATITEGLDGLGYRLAECAARGAVFAKWRAVIDVRTVSEYALETNTHALARYAAVCQEHGIVPIVEPEVLCSGAHSLDECTSTTRRTLEAVFDQLSRQKVDLSGIVLRPNMVTPGLSAPMESVDVVAATTKYLLDTCVPNSVPGVAFLSGGHTNAEACAYLSGINRRSGLGGRWSLTYSFGRALVSDALRTWGGEAENWEAAQRVLLANCERASAASRAGQSRAVAGRRRQFDEHGSLPGGLHVETGAGVVAPEHDEVTDPTK